MLAKHDPGVHDALLLNNMGVSTARTGIISSQVTLNTCVTQSGASTPIGTSDFTVIQLCPSLTALYGAAGGSITVGSKLMGMSMV